MRLLLIGESSYIGGRLHAHLAGEHEVAGLSSAQCNLLLPEHAERCLAALGPGDWVAVLLAVINKYARNSYESFLDNVTLVRTFLSAMRQVRPKSILFFSSVDVYGSRPELPVTEESLLRPNSWYALAKHVCEWMLLSSGEAPCPVTVLRIPGVYGRGRNDRSVVGSIAERLLAGETIGLTGGGGARRDFVHVEDLCRVVDALLPLSFHGVLNVATGQSVSMAQIVQTVGHALGIPPRIEDLPGNPERDFDLVFDISQLKTLLPGFRFRDLTEGVRCYLPPRQPEVR